MSKFLQIEFENPRMKKSEIADHIGYSSSTLQRYRNDINMLSPYRSYSNNTNRRIKKAPNTNFDNNLCRESDVERFRLTSNEIFKSLRNKKQIKRWWKN